MADRRRSGSGDRRGMLPVLVRAWVRRSGARRHTWTLWSGSLSWSGRWPRSSARSSCSSHGAPGSQAHVEVCASGSGGFSSPGSAEGPDGPASASGAASTVAGGRSRARGAIGRLTAAFVSRVALRAPGPMKGPSRWIRLA